MNPFGTDWIGIVLMIIWFLFVIGGIVGWIIFLMSVWRLMKAHEQLSKSIGKLAIKYLKSN
jgi:biopolymer transport protein ExbB/TolQ